MMIKYLFISAVIFYGILNNVIAQSTQQCYGTVIDHHQGKRQNGTNVLENRSVIANANGAPQDYDASNTPVNYYALGFGGDITFDFGSYIANGAGADFSVAETSYGSPSCNSYPEKAEVYISMDGSNFLLIDTVCQNGDIEIPASWSSIRFVKLHDISNQSIFTATADGYDIDGIKCLNGILPEAPPPVPLTACSAQHQSDYLPGHQKNNGNIALNRMNANKALGVPQQNDTYNFTTLGIGGSIILEFDFNILDKAGSDLQVIETSFSNPTCTKYPETAHFEGSTDKIHWSNLGNVCLDGLVDIAPDFSIRFIKITDATVSSLNYNIYPGSGDGFDIDGVICYDAATSGRVYDDVTTPDADDQGIVIYPNPTNSIINIDFTAEGITTVTLENYLGQTVAFDKMNFASNTFATNQIDMTSYSAGIYFVSVESLNGKQTVKVIKN